MLIDRSTALHDPDFCVRRGYHGPFSNAEKYDALPDWRGLADCAVCGSTCHVERQEQMRRLILASAGPGARVA